MLKALFALDDFAHVLDPHAVVYLATILVVLYLAKKSYDWLGPCDLSVQLTKEDNKAVAVAFSGYLFGVGLILLSVLRGEEQVGDAGSIAAAYLFDLGATAAWCLGGTVLLHVAQRINDRLILYAFSNVKEMVEDRNVGTGVVEAGGYIGSGLIIHAALSGSNSSIWAELVSTVLYFLAGQGAFVLFGLLYQKIVRFDLQAQLERDNAAAGVSFGFNLVAIAVLISAFVQQSDSLVGLFLWFVLGVFLLLTSRYVVDKIMLPGDLLDDEIQNDQNWGAALVEGMVAVALAFIVNACFLD